MNYEEFKEKLEELEIYPAAYGFGDIKDDVIGVSWTIGGRSGGSCYGDSEYYSLNAEPEPDLEEFDLILEKLVPNINFLTYNRLKRSLVERDSDRNNDYYGNYTDYARKWVSLRKLHQFLKDEGLL